MTSYYQEDRSRNNRPRDYSRSRSRDRDYSRRDSRRDSYGGGDRDRDRRDSRDSTSMYGSSSHYGGDRDRDSGRDRDRHRDNRRDSRDYGRDRRDHRDYRRDDDYKKENRGGNSRGAPRFEGPVPQVDQRDAQLPDKNDDPRIRGDGKKEVKIQKSKGGGRNTESFDPRSTLVRPAMRVVVGPNRPVYDKKLKHDDVVIVPEFFCKEEDMSLYYKLVEEMREVQQQQSKEAKGSEWISWHEGAHLISKNPTGSPTYKEIQAKISRYFEIENEKVGTRFNWYRDSSDWKPYHHDSAAFNPMRAKNQNITVGVSFGATRELSFLSAKTGEKFYFPQTNGMLFSFGRDVNINFKHGVNALAPEEQSGKGRISIILWGLAPNVVEEEGSPDILTDNTRGNGHSIHNKGGGGGGNRDENRGRR